MSAYVDQQATSDTLDSQTSPVSRYVILWVLLTLAVNSMIQPTGRVCGISIARRHRLYICFSPFMCLADALSIPVSVALICYRLDTSILTALRYALFWRDRAIPVEQEDVVDTSSDRQWPKWLVFALSTTPAILKLLSFSGVPWSQAWGLMYTLSYLFIEAASATVRLSFDEPADSAPAALGLSPARWDEEANNYMRANVESVNSFLSLAGKGLFWCARALQFGLVLWSMRDIRQHTIGDGIRLPSVIYVMGKWTRAVLRYASPMFIVPFIFIGLVHAFVGPKCSDPLESSHAREIILWICSGNLAVPLFSGEGAVDAESYSIFSSLPAICCYAVILDIWMERALRFIFSIQQWIGKALLGVVPVTTADVDAPGLTRTRYQIDEDGIRHLRWFLFDLGWGILWYAVRYNSVGTVNPGWTNVFG